jgi:hypothetical protein
VVTRAHTAAICAALFALVFCAPAGAAKPRRYAFGIPDVSMSEVMTFHGDGTPDCERSGVCGYSGTISYSFSGGDGLAAFTVSPHGVLGTADFFYEGLTSAVVQGPGGGAPCTDKVLQHFDGFEVEGTPGHIRLIFHPYWDVPLYLSTYCTGPSDIDMSHARALPEIVVTDRTLRRHRLHLEASSTRPFHSGPFEGSLSFQVNMRLRRAKHLSSIFQFLAGDL